MRKTLLLVAGIALFCFTNKAQAQMTFSTDDMEQVKKRKLIVITETPSEDLMKKLTKKKKIEEITNYQSALDLYNREMKEVVEKFWTFSATDIQYKSLKEVDELKDKTQYAIIYCTSGVNSVQSKHQDLEWAPKGDKIEGDGITLMAVGLAEGKKPICYVTMPDAFPTKADMVYGISSTNFMFNYKLLHVKARDVSGDKEPMVQNQLRLKNRTLLIRQDQIDSKLKPEDIKAAYPYSYRIVTADEMDQYVINADSNYAYTIIATIIGGRAAMYFPEVMDCKDGAGLAVSLSGMMAGHGVVTKNTLADFCQYISGKKK